jgi:hypothetical protein
MQLVPEKIPFAERRALRMAEATQYSGLGRTSIYDAIRAGQIEATKVGKRLATPMAPQRPKGKSPWMTTPHHKASPRGHIELPLNRVKRQTVTLAVK